MRKRQHQLRCDEFVRVVVAALALAPLPVQSHRSEGPYIAPLVSQLGSLLSDVKKRGLDPSFSGKLLRSYLGRATNGAHNDNTGATFHESLVTVNVHRKALTLVRKLSKLALHCAHDPGIDKDLLVEGPATLFAANLHNAGEIMPHFVLNLLRFAIQFPPSRVLVSIYESGSTDSTAEWMQLLRRLLDAVGVRHSLRNGDEVLREGEDRIEFLAAMRNRALQPLWDGSYAAAGMPLPDKVVFANDVYFCTDDLIRLLLVPANLACGMDYTNDRMQVYDLWVARDRGGNMMQQFNPFVSDAFNANRAKQGQPFAAGCCWNGAVAFDAQPFTAGGLRFRAPLRDAGECKASECSVFCSDFVRLGRDRIVVDPQVQLAYQRTHAEMLLRIKREMVEGATSGSSITKVMYLPALNSMNSMVDWEQAGPAVRSLCCPDDKEFWQDVEGLCYFEETLATNYTALWMAGGGRTG